jgi:hypothetical protein
MQWYKELQNKKGKVIQNLYGTIQFIEKNKLKRFLFNLKPNEENGKF